MSQVYNSQPSFKKQKNTTNSPKRPGTTSSAEPKPSNQALAQVEQLKSLNESRFQEIQSLQNKFNQSQDALKKSNAENLELRKRIAAVEKSLDSFTKAIVAQPIKNKPVSAASLSKAIPAAKRVLTPAKRGDSSISVSSTASKQAPKPIASSSSPTAKPKNTKMESVSSIKSTVSIKTEKPVAKGQKSPQAAQSQKSKAEPVSKQTAAKAQDQKSAEPVTASQFFANYTAAKGQGQKSKAEPASRPQTATNALPVSRSQSAQGQKSPQAAQSQKSKAEPVSRPQTATKSQDQKSKAEPVSRQTAAKAQDQKSAEPVTASQLSAEPVTASQLFANYTAAKGQDQKSGKMQPAATKPQAGGKVQPAASKPQTANKIQPAASTSRPQSAASTINSRPQSPGKVQPVDKNQKSLNTKEPKESNVGKPRAVSNKTRVKN